MSTETITITDRNAVQPGDVVTVRVTDVGPGTDNGDMDYTFMSATREVRTLPAKSGVVVEDVDHQMRYFRANGLDYPWVSETGTWQSDVYVSRLNWRAVPDTLIDPATARKAVVDALATVLPDAAIDYEQLNAATDAVVANLNIRSGGAR